MYAAAGLLLLFAMNRCSVACTRGQRLSRYENTSVAVADSLNARIASSDRMCDSLRVVIGNLQQDTTYLRRENQELQNTNKQLLEKATRQQDVHVHWDKQQ